MSTPLVEVYPEKEQLLIPPLQVTIGASDSAAGVGTGAEGARGDVRAWEKRLLSLYWPKIDFIS